MNPPCTHTPPLQPRPVSEAQVQRIWITVALSRCGTPAHSCEPDTYCGSHCSRHRPSPGLITAVRCCTASLMGPLSHRHPIRAAPVPRQASHSGLITTQPLIPTLTGPPSFQHPGNWALRLPTLGAEQLRIRTGDTASFHVGHTILHAKPHPPTTQWQPGTQQ